MFSELIVAYLFLGGAGAGCAFVCSMLGLLSDPRRLEGALASGMTTADGRLWSRLFATSLLVALGFLLLGSVCLVADLGQPERVLLLLFQPMPTYVAFGAWAIVACSLVTTFLALAWKGIIGVNRSVLTMFEILASIASVAVMVYAGLFLSDIQAVPFWNTPWLVVLFVLSALSCGIALVFCSAFASNTIGAFDVMLARLAKVDAVLIVAELVAGALCLFSVWIAAGGAQGPGSGTDAVALLSIQNLFVGPFAALFWVGFLVVGLAIPFVQDVIIGHSVTRASVPALVRNRTLLMIGTSVCVLIGGIVLRFLVVGVALHPVVSSL